MFTRLQTADPDPIFALVEEFRNDQRKPCVNLTVGVYQDEDGKMTYIPSVKKVADKVMESDHNACYLGLDGSPALQKIVQQLNFGEELLETHSERIASIQTPGGTGALRLGAEFAGIALKQKIAFMSSPTWANHKKIFVDAGYEVADYPYFDKSQGTIAFEALKAAASKYPENSVFLMHACCHNPTGLDFSPHHLEQLLEVFRDRKILPFVDCAYQGFGQGIEEDGWMMRRLLQAEIPFLLATSFSKNASMYKHRLGALTVIANSRDEALAAKSIVKSIARGVYSNPPAFGAQVVEALMEDKSSREQWEKDLCAIRARIGEMRERLIAGLIQRGVAAEHMKKQSGMFSYTGWSSEVIAKLKRDFAIYVVGSGRICVAALNESNIDYVIESVAKAHE